MVFLTESPEFFAAMPDACRTCGKPLNQSGKGRKRRYCGIPCRRAQEAAVDRLRAALAGVEAEIERHNAHPSAWGAHRLPHLLPKRDRLARELAELQR